MTGQDLLDRMELLNAELQLQPGEEDATKGLTALNVAQDYYESLAAQRGKIHGSQVGVLDLTENVEGTLYPTGVLRIDRLQVLSGDSHTFPVSELTKINRAGGHAGTTKWPWNLLLTSSTGKPDRYWTNGTVIYWSPRPATTYTVRWYGFKVADDITASGTFAYPDIVSLPLSSFAARLMKVGVEDPTQDLSSLAQETFKSTLDALENFNRDGATGLEYTQPHYE